MNDRRFFRKTLNLNGYRSVFSFFGLKHIIHFHFRPLTQLNSIKNEI